MRSIVLKNNISYSHCFSRIKMTTAVNKNLTCDGMVITFNCNVQRFSLLDNGVSRDILGKIDSHIITQISVGIVKCFLQRSKIVIANCSHILCLEVGHTHAQTQHCSCSHTHFPAESVFIVIKKNKIFHKIFGFIVINFALFKSSIFCTQVLASFLASTRNLFYIKSQK